MERSRDASLLVCDDIRVEANGKLILVGVYTSDIGITGDEQQTPMIQFLFTASCDLDDPFKFIRFEVTLPGNGPVFAESKLSQPPPQPPGRFKISVRHAVSIPNAILRPGKIEAKVIHERGEIPVVAAWITRIDQAKQSPANPA